MTSVLTGTYWTSLGATLVKTLRSHPRESLIALAMTISFCIAIADPSDSIQQGAIRMGMGFSLGIAISIASGVLNKSGKINAAIDWVFTSLAVGASTWHAQYLNFDNSDGIIEFTYLAVLVHLFAAVTWIVNSNASAFWNANTGMFYRALFAFVFTSLLVTGLTTASSAVRILFGLLTFNELEGYLAVIAYGFFMTLFFLAEMPTHERSQRDSVVPKLTITFVQYVLVPLIAIFTAILYAYAIKLLTTSISTDMAHFVVWLTGTAVLASLLTWPLRNEQKPLLKFVHTWLYPLMLPLLLIGTWSLWVRLTSDGVDFVGFTLGVFMSIGLITVVISIVLRTTDPRIPAVASFIVFALTSVGPLGVVNVVSNSMKSHATVASSKKIPTVYTGLAKPLLRQARIVTYENGEHWVTTFHCSADTVSSSEVRVAYEGKGALVVIRRNHNDTLRFDLASLLSKLNPADSIYPPQTITNEKGRRATLLISSMATFENASDSLKPAVRELSWIEGAVYCEPK